MHVLLVPSWYPPQGGDFFRIQAEKICLFNHFVGVIYLEEYSIKDLFKSACFRKIFKLRIENENSLKVVRYAWIRFPKFEWLNLQIRTLLYKKIYKAYKRKFGSPDILHAHSTLWGGYFCSHLKKSYGIPYVITEHRGRFNIRNKLPNTHIRWWFKFYLSKALGAAGKTICVTKYQIDYLITLSEKLVRGNFIEIPNIFESNFSCKEIIKKKSGRPFTLLNIAIFSGYKNHQLLILAVEHLVTNGFTDIKVLLAGNGELMEKYKKMVEEKKLAKHIEFMGYCNQQRLIELLEKSDYMILSSIAEGQPVSILEAFAMGIPVIVPDIITDRIVNENYGFVYKTGDLDDIIEKIKQAKNSSDKFDQELLRGHAMKNFSADAIIPEIIGVYEEVLSNK
jgi:glycosyltransferase involved in cell wall biosynthesis